MSAPMRADLRDLKVSSYRIETDPQLFGMARFSDGYEAKFSYQMSNKDGVVIRLWKRAPEGRSGWRVGDGWEPNDRPALARCDAISSAVAPVFHRLVDAERKQAAIRQVERDRREVLRHAHYDQQHAGPVLYAAIRSYLANEVGAASVLDAALRAAQGEGLRKFRVRAIGDERWHLWPLRACSPDAVARDYAFSSGNERKDEDGYARQLLPSEVEVEEVAEDRP